MQVHIDFQENTNIDNLPQLTFIYKSSYIQSFFSKYRYMFNCDLRHVLRLMHLSDTKVTYIAFTIIFLPGQVCVFPGIQTHNTNYMVMYNIYYVISLT